MKNWHLARRDLLKGLGVGAACLPLLRSTNTWGAPAAAKKFVQDLPIRFNVGIGPAVGFDWKRSYGVSADKKVIESDKATDLDAIATFSGYYLPRYLDGSSFTSMALIPRPMLGFSLKDPLSSIYLGLQFDPIQFLDISIGAKLSPRTELAGAHLDDIAMVDKDGAVIPPATRSRLHAAMFVSLTASSGLFTSWISALTK